MEDCDRTRLSAKPLRWLYLDLNSYFASVEQQLRPALRGRPVAVAPVMTDSTCAIAASYEAKAFGIRTGTPIHEAKRLCPDLVVVPARHDEYVRFHHAVIDAINHRLPITKVCSIDEVACLLLDNENAPERAREIAQTLKQGIAEDVGPWLRSSIGIAPNRYLAKVASNFQKPDGLTVITAAELPDRLRPLPLRALPGIGARMEARLKAAGLASVSDLVDLTPNAMLRLWAQMARDTNGMPILKTGVTLLNLSAAQAEQPDLFDTPANSDKPLKQERNLKLWAALDAINAHYGKDAVRYGFSREMAEDRFTGTKIAFTRIPEISEFHR